MSEAISSVFQPTAAGIPRSFAGMPGKLPGLERVDHVTAIVVRRCERDAREHTKNARIAGWVMESAESEERKGDRLGSLDIGFLAEVHRGDPVVVRVRREGGRRLRHAVARAGEEREIARAVTSWV
jgi:hypothetical protein